MIGMPALIEFSTLEENLKLCKDLNLDFIELNLSLPMYNNMDLESTKDLLNRYGIKVSLHLSELFNPFELDSVLRKAHLEVFKQVLEYADTLDALLINMHLLPGVHFKLPNKKIYLYDQYKELYLTYVSEFIEVVEKSSLKKLCVENTGIHHMPFIEEATNMLLKSDKMSLTYDIGHDITSGYNDKSYFENNLGRVDHYHIHDGTSEKNHLSLFTGDLDIKKFVDRAQMNHKTYVIEVKSSESLIESINQLKEKNLI